MYSTFFTRFVISFFFKTSLFIPLSATFLFTLILWVAFVIAVYYLIGRNIAELLGFNFSPDDAETVIGLGYFITPEF